MARLIARLMLPIIVLVALLTSICLADLVYRLRAKAAARPKSRSKISSQRAPTAVSPANYVPRNEADPLLKHSPSEEPEPSASLEKDASYQSMDGTFIDLLEDPKDDHSQPPATPYEYAVYPLSAFLSSTAITVAQFFYFGTALTATEYFFSSVQLHTNVKYVQSQPWMKYDDAAALRNASIPFLMVYVFGIPAAFLVAVWKVRHKAASPVVTKFFGTIFVRFRPSFFWWEILNVIRKLAIALFLRGISAASAFQPGLVIWWIGTFMCIQATMQPWKRSLENLMDTTAAFLLISTTVATHLSSMLHANAVMWTVLFMDCCFILASIILIIYQACTGTTEYQYNWILRHHTINQPQIDFGEPLLREDLNLYDEGHEQSQVQASEASASAPTSQRSSAQ